MRHNVFRALLTTMAGAPAHQPPPQQQLQSSTMGRPQQLQQQEQRPRRRRTAPPLSRGAFLTTQLAVLVLLQLLSAALAAPRRKLDDGGGGGGDGGGAGAGQNGEEEVAGVYMSADGTTTGGGGGGDRTATCAGRLPATPAGMHSVCRRPPLNSRHAQQYPRHCVELRASARARILASLLPCSRNVRFVSSARPSIANRFVSTSPCFPSLYWADMSHCSPCRSSFCGGERWFR